MQAKSKNLPALLKECQYWFNRYIRLRDLRGEDWFKCISCGQIKSVDQMDAGHYYNVGYYSAMRFDVDNCHGQCKHCNNFLSGNLIEYTKTLPLKIGKERFELLEIKAGACKRSDHKWHRYELLYLIEEFKREINDLEY